jgi:spore coat polysaccharide biosynthesis protein SpsF
MNDTQEVLAVVQARMSSTRLPGKVMADVGGEPMLALQLARLARAQQLNRVVVATSTDAGDDAIADLVRDQKSDVYRGPLDDVLARFVGAAAGHSGPIMRITADCPLIDPAVVDQVIDLFRATAGCDYASNIEPRTYPIGLDVEVVASEVLRQVATDATEPNDREHVTWAIRRQLDRYRSATLTNDRELGDVRWTVDEADDLAFVREVVGRLGPRRYEAGLDEILGAILREPSLADYRGRRA